MKSRFDPVKNYQISQKAVGYVSFAKATDQTYSDLGFMCGLEIHQQLLTDKKLFCRCPAGIYQDFDQYDAEIVRHMRPTLSEMGGYDGTALMESKTKKNIFYRIKNETACTYDTDDTPPFGINQKALDTAIEISLLLGANIVGELHITRKQYLDGSIPTGFQRTGIVSVAGEIPISFGKVQIIQLSIEEDSCREVSDIGHDRIFRTDRLGMPLIEIVTSPGMKTPSQVTEVASYLRFLTRSTDHVRTGIGAARQDVNVSITGSTRVEIKGVPRIRSIPKLTHNEAFRHKALLRIKKELLGRINDLDRWDITFKDIRLDDLDRLLVTSKITEAERITAVNLPGFKSILSHFTQPGRCFADELSDRLRVIACLDKPNMLHSEQVEIEKIFTTQQIKKILADLSAKPDDAQLIIWGAAVDVETGLETVTERCKMAFDGIPSETRRAMPDGTTLFERVLPGADRMYPDTDSAPIAIDEKRVEDFRASLPPAVSARLDQLREWQVPLDCYEYLLRHNLVGKIIPVTTETDIPPKFIATLLAHRLKNIEGKKTPAAPFNRDKVFDLLRYLHSGKLHYEIAYEILPEMYQQPKMDFDSLLTTAGYERTSIDEILDFIPSLNEKFKQINSSQDHHAYLSWVMGNLRGPALGNLKLADLKTEVEKVVARG